MNQCQLSEFFETVSCNCYNHTIVKQFLTNHPTVYNATFSLTPSLPNATKLVADTHDSPSHYAYSYFRLEQQDDILPSSIQSVACLHRAFGAPGDILLKPTA